MYRRAWIALAGVAGLLEPVGVPAPMIRRRAREGYDPGQARAQAFDVAQHVRQLREELQEPREELVEDD